MAAVIVLLCASAGVARAGYCDPLRTPVASVNAHCVICGSRPFCSADRCPRSRPLPLCRTCYRHTDLGAFCVPGASACFAGHKVVCCEGAMRKEAERIGRRQWRDVLKCLPEEEFRHWRQ